MVGNDKAMRVPRQPQAEAITAAISGARKYGALPPAICKPIALPRFFGSTVAEIKGGAAG